MAGSDPGFDAQEFRDAIHFAMAMGAPEDVTRRLTFRWEEASTFANSDPASRPYNWSSLPTTQTTITDLVVDCAWRFAGSEGPETAVGAFNPAHIIITLLDDEYNTIIAHGGGRFADYIKADDDIYEVRFIPPPQGLFDVTIWEVHAEARSET